MTKNVVLTPKQRKDLERLKSLEAQEKEAIKNDRQALKDLTSETAKDVFDILMKLSTIVTKVKKEAYEKLLSVIELKRDIYQSTDEQFSHTFTTDCGLYRIIAGFNVIDHFDDSHTAGVDGVLTFLNSLSKGEGSDSEIAVDVAKDALKKDSKGNLNARKVMKLQQKAIKSGRKEFIDNVQIIIDAYKPMKSKIYIQAKYRDTKDMEWKNLPLGITEANVD